MSDIDNGGQAFPGPAFTRAGHPNGHDMGMTLRDWFATHASEADIEDCREMDISIDGYPFFKFTREQARYRYADAMLKVRQGGAA